MRRAKRRRFHMPDRPACHPRHTGDRSGNASMDFSDDSAAGYTVPFSSINFTNGCRPVSGLRFFPVRESRNPAITSSLMPGTATGRSVVARSILRPVSGCTRSRTAPGSSPGSVRVSNASGLFLVRQQQLDLTPQAGVSAACNFEESRPRLRLTLQSRVE